MHVFRPLTKMVRNIVEPEVGHGFKNHAEAKAWAKEHIARTYSGEETGGKGDIRISNAAVDKYLSQSAVDKSESKDVHLAVLKVLPDVIRESVDAEQHADFKKGKDGVRSAANGVNPNVTIHRLYGAVRMDGRLYRVKVTLKENTRTKETPKAYSYEATKIELLEGSLSQTEGSHNLEPSNSKSEVSAGQHGNVSGLTSTFPRYSDKSITAANLLNGVDKSYGGGKFFEDYNKIREQFIGEKGAAAADHADEVNTRLDNLSVAREMEAEKKDAKAIKLATGWERGADGKWCYEMPDAKVKDVMDIDGHVVKRYDENVEDVRYRTSEELGQEYGSRWIDEQTNEDGRHTTQGKNTINSYKKFGDWVKRDSGGRNVDVLDASSGLGLGTEWLRENGINVEDVEPYPSENRTAPTYISYGEVKKKYDYIISNAVLNVIPDDWRANVLHNMAEKLKVGGKLVINVRSAESIRKQGKEGETRITLDDPSEILVLRPNGSIKAYQKGFTKAELKEWCEKELGKGYSVEIANDKNAGGSYDTAVVVTKNNESGTIGVASEAGRPRRSAQALPSSNAKLDNNQKFANNLLVLSENLSERDMGAHEFLFNVAKAFGLNGQNLNKSFYQDLSNSVGIRISDHSANTDNITNRNECER